MALPPKRTLGSLRREIQARLGFAAQGELTEPQRETIDSFLADAQEQLYWHYDFPELWQVEGLATVAGTVNYEWPANIEPRRVTRVSAQLFDNQWWHELRQGIEHYHDSVADQPPSYPRRFDVRDRLELWPIPDAAYLIRIEGYVRLQPFADSTDEATLDDRLVFLHGLAAGKAHYRQPDAQAIASQANALLSRLRGAAHVSRRYTRGHRRTDYTPPVPRRV